MSAVLSTVMKPELSYNRDQLKASSHVLGSSSFDSGYLGEVASAGYALMSNLYTSHCRSEEPVLPKDMLLAAVVRAFTASFRSIELHNDHIVRLSVSREISAWKELYQLTMVNHGSHMQLRLQSPIEWALPEYSYAFNRLKIFCAEENNWDGYGGRPASPAVGAQVHTFLKVAQRSGIKVPSLAMGGDGSVAVVWKNEELYISADFDGKSDYSFFITQGDEYIKGGVSSSDMLDIDLAQYLTKYFTDDIHKNL